MHLQDTHLSKNLRSSADVCDKLWFLLAVFQASTGKENGDVSVVLIMSSSFTHEIYAEP